MSNIRTFTITGVHEGGDGGAGVTLYTAECDGHNVVIAAPTGQYSTGQRYTASLSGASKFLYNGHRVDYQAKPSR